MAIETGPEQQLELFTRFVMAAREFDDQHVIGAAANIIAWGLRVRSPTMQAATARVDEIGAKIKEVLSTYYDPSTGQKRAIMPTATMVDPQ